MEGEQRFIDQELSLAQEFEDGQLYTRSKGLHKAGDVDCNED